jgi:hypothetical protein
MIRLYTRLCQVCTISQVRVEKYKRSLFSHAFCQHVHLSLCNVLEFPVQTRSTTWQRQGVPLSPCLASLSTLAHIPNKLLEEKDIWPTMKRMDHVCEIQYRR